MPLLSNDFRHYPITLGDSSGTNKTVTQTVTGNTLTIKQDSGNLIIMEAADYNGDTRENLSGKIAVIDGNYDSTKKLTLTVNSGYIFDLTGMTVLDQKAEGVMLKFTTSKGSVTAYVNNGPGGNILGLSNDVLKGVDSVEITDKNNGTFIIEIDNTVVDNITAPNTAPTVTTQAVSNITQTTATGKGEITALGSPNPVQYGVVWGTSENPTVALTTKTEQGTASATGEFTSSITGLTAGTTYHVRAYATNSAGTSYGGDVTFTTEASSYKWDGTADTDWYTSNHAGTSFTIDTEEELAGLASIVNAGTDTFSGDVITLDADLDLAGHNWTPIGNTETKYFAGTFNGDGHVVSSMSVSVTESSGSENALAGLFGALDYAGTVKNAGYSADKFGPNDKITREQAMTITARMMKITGLDYSMTEGEAENLLQPYSDSASASSYAREGLAACLKTGVVYGRNNNTIAPGDNITRAETAAIAQRLLQKSGLI
ncbi:MAG: S-layer homology domain-containing protein [Syntrophomonas sp.]